MGLRFFIGILLARAVPAIACGDFFCGDSLLLEGDNSVLVAPTANFYLEVARTQGNRTPFRADSTQYQSKEEATEQSGNAEATDLRTCLRKAKLEEDTAREVLQAHAILRDKLKKYVDDFERWNSSRPGTGRTTTSFTKHPSNRHRKFHRLILLQTCLRNLPITSKAQFPGTTRPIRKN